ncbi:MAG: hypothetical protein QOH91_325 [Mycobacterium sp.]|jgi:hypothetical protein|nr:hypothetical protein [Mycobacterium sp.]
MREREQAAAAIPTPRGLLDYRVWCAERGVAPYGSAADQVSMRAAVDQWGTWERLRREWAAAHGVDEDDLGGGGDAPFDVDAI